MTIPLTDSQIERLFRRRCIDSAMASSLDFSAYGESCVTLDDIMEAKINPVDESLGFDVCKYMRVTMIGGMNIVSSPLIPAKDPKIPLGKVNVSPEFRAEFNRWSVEMFGSTATAYIFDGNVAMNPEVKRELVSNVVKFTDVC